MVEHPSSAEIDTRLVPLASIHPSPRNPRQKMEDIADLAASIQEYGLLQPVVIRAFDDAYQIVAGHRRVEAAKSLGWLDIPAVVREATDDQAYLLTLIENLQRDDLSAREESKALEVLVRERQWSTRQVAQAVKRSQAYVSKRLRVFEDPVLAPLVLHNRLAVTTAEELLPAPPLKRKALALQAVEEQWNASIARAAVRKDRPRSDSSARATSLLQTLRTLRKLLKQTFPSDLQDAHRREMRLVFLDLAVLAKAPVEQQNIVLPALPVESRSRPRDAD